MWCLASRGNLVFRNGISEELVSYLFPYFSGLNFCFERENKANGGNNILVTFFCVFLGVFSVLSVKSEKRQRRRTLLFCDLQIGHAHARANSFAEAQQINGRSFYAWVNDSIFEEEDAGDGAFDQNEVFPQDAAQETLARVHLAPGHYLTGFVEDDTFHPQDEVSGGNSHFSLTGKKAPYTPMKLSAIEGHGALLEYVVTR